MREAEYEFKEEMPTSFRPHGAEEGTYSNQLSLSEKCNNMRKNLMNTDELKVSPDTIDLLDKCPEELYEEIIRKKISKLNYN